MARFNRGRENRLKKSIRAVAAFAIIAAIASTSIPLNSQHLQTNTVDGIAELEDFMKDENQKEKYEDEFYDEKYGDQEYDEWEDYDEYYYEKWEDEDWKEDKGWEDHHEGEEKHKEFEEDHEESDFKAEFAHFDDGRADFVVQNWKIMMKELEHSLEHTEKMMEKSDDPSDLEDRAEMIQELIYTVEERAEQVEELRDLAVDGDEDAQQKMRTLDTLSFAMRLRVDFVVMSDEVWRMRQMMDKLDGEVDYDFSELRAILAEVEDMKEETKDLFEDIANAVDSGADENELYELDQQIFDLTDRLHETFQKFWELNPGSEIREAEDEFHKERFKDRMGGEIDQMTEMLGMVREFVAEVKGLNIDDSETEEAVEELYNLVIKARNLLVDMKLEVQEGNYEIVDMWDKMDRIGDAADKPVRIIMAYLDENPEAVDSLSAEAREVYESGMMDEEHEGEDEFYDDLEYLYGDFDKEDFRDFEKDDLRALMGSLSEDNMERLKKYLDNPDAARMLKRFMKDFDIYGDRAEELIENYIAVIDAIVVEDPQDLPIGLRGQYFRTVQSVISTEVVDELIAAWREAVAAYEAGETDLSEYEDAIDELLNRNREELVSGEGAVEFEDVSYDGDEWYRDFVFEGRGQYWNGYSGDRAGEFGPGDGVTFAEILKMAMESAGIQASGSDSEVSGQWFEAYVATAKRNGYNFVDDVDDWNSVANRADVAVIIAEVHGLEKVTYKNVYPDVDANNEDAEYLQAVYDAGFMTGKGDGTFDPYAGINRAETAKVIVEAAEYAEGEQFWEELDQYEVEEDEERVLR